MYMTIEYSFIIAAYLLGSISSAIVICKLFRLGDPRQLGSKNPGTTNVLRLGGKFPAILTLLGDFLKGFLPVFVANYFPLSYFDLSLIGLAAFLGHLFPLFFGFKGGKGVATYFGAMFGLNAILGVMATATWLIIALLFRYSSLAALVMAFVTPLYILWLINFPTFLIVALMSLILILRHHENIQRLIQGRESKLGQKKT